MIPDGDQREKKSHVSITHFGELLHEDTKLLS